MRTALTFAVSTIALAFVTPVVAQETQQVDKQVVEEKAGSFGDIVVPTDPAALAAFLADQADLSSKGWPRYVRVSSALPTTATNKIIKRELKQEGATARTDEQLWMREPRGKNYRVSI